MGTLMPYPLEDPPRLLEVSLPERRLFMLLAFNSLVFTPPWEGGIHSISIRDPVPRADWIADQVRNDNSEVREIGVRLQLVHHLHIIEEIGVRLQLVHHLHIIG